MLGRKEISDTNLTGQRCPCTHHPAFFQRINWPKRVHTVWPQWIFQPWPQLWIDPSSLIGPSVWSEHYATIWTGPQTSGRIRSWSLSPSRKVSTKTSHLPPSPHGSNRLRSYVMSFLIKRPTLYIMSKPMMSGPLLLLRLSNRESPWNRFCQPATQNHIIPARNSI